MTYLPRESLSDILGNVTPSDLLDREGVDYKETFGSSGAQLNIRECPFCGGSKWKVYMNAESGVGNCFHGDCDTRFSFFDFAKKLLGDVSNREAVEVLKQLAAENGWRPKKVTVERPAAPEGGLVIPDSVPIPYKGRNLNYLKNRSISTATAEHFGLRFSLNGVFRFMFDGRETFQSYANRVIIPVHDIDGKLVSFQGRDTTGMAERKYLFPPGYASTGSVVYNAHNCVGKKVVVMGEGAFDVMAIHDALGELEDVGVAGSFGKSLSMGGGSGSDQLSVLLALKQKGLQQVIFLWDGEKSAIKAAIDAALALRQYGIDTFVGVLPEGKDPNEVTAAEVKRAAYSATGINLISAATMLARL